MMLNKTGVDKQALREAAERAMHDDWGYDTDIFHEQVTPSVVLALLDELEADKEQIKTLESRNRRLDGIIDAAEKRVTELECIATDYGVKFQKAQDALKHQALLHKSQMEATEKRIAELEAREVMLPDRKSEIFWPGDAFEFDILGYVIAVKSAIRAAGIKVK